ncbi:MAG: quinone oxidoreductase [Alphaproteobacteria bacterium]|nr:quinone oxidoreductase [Alphaproteobacteria bacterium]
MPHAIRLHTPGGPENLRWEPVTVGEPGPGQARVRHRFAGLNYIDIHFRRGEYNPGPLPAVLGREGAGVVEAIGPGVTEVQVGQRVGYASQMGAYSEAWLFPAERLVPLPDDIGDDIAAAVLLKGMTAHMLVTRVRRLGPGDTLLYHAAAGGLGLIVCQWAKHLGATVIGTVGSREKAALAKSHGCDHVIVYSEEDFVTRVRDLTAGKGASAIYDAVGKATLEKSLSVAAPFGTIASYGAASGSVPREVATKLPVDRFLIYPTLPGHVAGRANLLAAAAALFDVLRKNIVVVRIGQRYALRDAAQAHVDLEARRTTGSTILEV